MALLMSTTATLTQPNTQDIPTPTQPTTTTPLTQKSKKRARFADENQNEPQQQQQQQQQQQSLSSFITFNHDDPPLKKAKTQKHESSSFDLFDLSASDTLRNGMYLTFINTAFTERTNGKFERYDQLLGQFDPLVSPQSTSDLNPPNVSLARVQGWLSALTSMVSQLDRGHSHLVEKVLSLPWTVLDDQFVSLYTRFVNGLVSARSEWVQLVLENLVRGFHYSTIPLEHRSALLPSSVNRRLIYSRLHSLLRSILRLIPTLPSTLSPLLDLYFPKKREHRDGHICYLSNILKIASYCPDLRPKIVQLCVEKCLKIDVEIQVEVEEWEDDEGRLEAEIFGKSIEDALDRSWMDEDAQDSDVDEEEEDADSEEVNFDDLSSDDGNLSEDEKDKISTVASPQSIRKVKKLAAKLDGMLRCIFDHLQQICFGASLPSPTSATTDTITTTTTTTTTTSSPPPPTITSPLPPTTTPSPVTEDTTDATKEQPIIPPVDPQRDFDRDAIFDHLLTNFESAILRTRRTRHVQFIIFWYASMQPRFTNLLLATLVERGLYETEDNSLPVATRVAAVSYIASLISRAKYIDKDMTRYVVSLLCARLQMGMNEPKKMNVNGHVVWYAIAQAIFYIFCFRWKDLLVEDDDDEPGTAGMGECEGLTIHLTQPKKFNERWLSGLKILERAIVSPFNPLKACTDSVVSQFAKISHDTNFIYCYDIIRRNSHTATKETNKKSQGMTWSKSTQSSSNTSCTDSCSPTTTESSGEMVDGPPPPRAPTTTTMTTTTTAAAAGAAPWMSSTFEQAVQKALSESKNDLSFPFDPFKLPLSSVYLQSIYRSWEDVNDVVDDEDDDDDDPQ